MSLHPVNVVIDLRPQLLSGNLIPNVSSQTWAGIQAAKQLEAKGMATQVFLVFSLVQAIAAAQAGVSVIQPSVGRVREW